MRSVVVVLPASICAEMPMLRYRSIGVFLATAISSEPVMRKGFVRFSHAMDLFALLHRTAAALGRFLQLAREPHGHRLLAALLRRLADPAHRERHAAHRPHFDRHL